MKKRNYLSLLATLAALGAASGLNTPTVQADGGNEADKSLLPVVFLTLDTSGSMFEDINTTDYNCRFTNAIQELSGSAKVNTAVPYISPNKTRFPRKQLRCNETEDRCAYETVWICGEQYSGVNDSSKCDVVNSKEAKKGSICSQIGRNEYCVDYSMRNLEEGFDGDEASFARQYANDGLIHQFMNTVKFGIVTMAQDSHDFNPYYSYHTEKYTYHHNDKYYPSNIKQNFYGDHVTTVPGFVNGTNDIDYKYGFSGYKLNDKIGAWNNEIFTFTPSFYPTTSDDPGAVRSSNEALIYNIRSYTLRNMGTPLGGMIYALRIMFSNDKQGGAVDPGLILQPKPNGKYIEPARDDAWACRPKAVVALTDGEPNDTTSQSSAKALYRMGVKVYAIAYGDSDASPVGKYTSVADIKEIMGLAENSKGGKINPGIIMNKIAWKGGTCHEYGHVGDVIDPEDVTGYENYLKNYMNDSSHTTYGNCFYNAYNGLALRTAMTEILSDLLEGYTSKSKMVTTTAVGKLTTVDEDNKPVNGWYNVYSGYRINLGSMRNSALQRETYACRDGKFEYDKSLFIDMAKKLEDRLENCRTESVFADSENEILKAIKGDCITNRAIFVGDYSDDDVDDTKGRYALKPSIIHFSDSKAGVIQYGAEHSQYHFFAYNNDKKSSYESTKSSLIDTDNFDTIAQISRYIISPYECKTEIDCVNKSGNIEEQFVCDNGQCVPNADLANYSSCTPGRSSCSENQVCFSRQCRDLSNGCLHHSDCLARIVDGETYNTSNQVCHLGSCVNGVLLDGDIRDLIASIPLGAIEYASPVIVGPPSYSYHGADYVTYKNTYADRDTMLYVPANDGMLHAFILGKNNENSYSSSMFSGITSPKFNVSDPKKLEGEELWAFIPKAVFKDLHSLTSFGDQKKINVAPVYADVQFPDGDGGGAWHSVIVGGFREGGRGYYALDVTEPNDPKILWEIDHQWQSVSTDIPYPEISNDMTLSVSQEAAIKENGHYPFARMGFSYPEAAITNIIVDGEIVPVAILSGGLSKGEPTTDCIIDGTTKACFDDVTGKAVYVVRLNPETKEDLLIREFQFDSRITGTPSTFPAGFNSIARLIYVGDENGALHRIDMSDPNIDNWTIDGVSVTVTGKVAKPSHDVLPIFDPNNIAKLKGDSSRTYEKITYKPAVSAVTATGFPDIQIVFGSGDSSNLAIGQHDLNYTAVVIDHYVDQETGYQLNNFRADQTLDAYTNHINPLVIVFNPINGITSQPLASYDVPGGKKQYFEVWADKVAPYDDDENTVIDEPPIDPCGLCTGELCNLSNSSCRLECGNICNCYDEIAICEDNAQTCQNEYTLCESAYASCNSDAERRYTACNNDVTKKCNQCKENNVKICKENCTKSCNDAYTTCVNNIETTCYHKAENYFCDWFGSIHVPVIDKDIKDIGLFSWFFKGTCAWLVSKVKSFISEPKESCFLLVPLDNCIRNALKDVLSVIDEIFTKRTKECEDEEESSCSTSKITCINNCNTTCTYSGHSCDDDCKNDCVKDVCPHDCTSCPDTDCDACLNEIPGLAGSGRSRAAKRGSSGSGINFDIRAGQKMMGPALTYNFKSYFPTYNATLSSGACNDGFASIWMIDRSNHDLHWSKKSASQVQNYRDYDASPITGSTDHGKSSTSFAHDHYINLANGTKVYGLAMTPQAICIKGDKATIAAPQLIAQTGGASGASGASQSAAGGFTKTGDTLSDGESTNINLLSITEDAIKAEPDVLSWASVYE